MDNTTTFWVSLAVALLSGWDAIIRNIRNFTDGITGWWNGLAPVIQLALVVLVIYLLAKRK